MRIIIIFLMIITISIISGCRQNETANVGTFRDGNWFIKVIKAGDQGYFITKKNKDLHYSFYGKWYCIFKDGCYLEKETFPPIFCIKGNNLIDDEGNTYYRQKDFSE